MQGRYRSFARGSFVAAAMSLVLAACGGNGGTTGEGPPRSPTAATSEPASQADPLVGEWRHVYTCQDSLRAIESHLSPKQIRQQAGSLQSFLGEDWGAEPTKDDPCHGATGSREMLARFADGNLTLFRDGAFEAQATYELLEDHSIIVNNDPQKALCPCPGTWEFEIAGDQVTFRVEPHIDIVNNWEATPWVRES